MEGEDDIWIGCDIIGDWCCACLGSGEGTSRNDEEGKYNTYGM